MGIRLRGISVEMRGIWVEMQKNVGNKGGDAGNQGGNLSIAVEMTQNSNGNSHFHTLDLMPFLLKLNSNTCKKGINCNLVRLFRGSFCGGWGGSKIIPYLKLIQIMLETLNLVRK